MRICPVCEGYTTSAVARCSTCDAPLIGAHEIAWARRDDAGAGNPWLGLVVGGKYRITGMLGKGGMGTVYRAVHELSHSAVALKVLNPRFARHRDFKETLIGEARKASLLGSEYVSRVVDVGETPEGAVFFAMELVEGETLHDLLERSGPLPPAVLEELLLQLTAALDDAQAAGLVHRDLSPKNIMVETRADGFRAKVLDFGIARLQRQEAAEDVGHWVNPPFTAPEILQGGAGDHRSDLYSLGVIAYQCLSGQLPHGGATIDDRVREAIEREPRPLAPAASTPRALQRLVRELIAKEPDERPSLRRVRETVQRLRRPHGVPFQVVAVLAFIAGSTAFLTSLTAARSPTLQSSSASSLLLATEPVRGERPQFVRVEALRTLSLRVADVRPGELVVRGFEGAARSPSFELPLGGDLASGELWLDAARHTGWAAVLDRCVQAGAAVSLDFLHRPTNRLIAFARVFVDTKVPALEVVSGPRRRLNLATKMRAVVREDTELAGIEFRLMKAGQTLATWSPSLPPSGTEFELDLGRELGMRALPGRRLDGVANARLEWSLTDRAGRVSPGTRLPLPLVDLVAPEIASVTGPDTSNTLEVDERQCRVRVRLAGPEAHPAILHVKTSAGESRRVDHYPIVVAPAPVDSFPMKIAVPAPGPEARVDLEFWLEDSAGNESRPWSNDFTLKQLALDSRWRVVGGTRHARLESEPSPVLYVAAEQRVRLDYRCNRSYEPVAQSDIETVSSAPGECVLVAGPFRPGKHEIVVGHHPGGRERAPIDTKVTLPVRCLPAPPAVRPRASATAATVWLPVALANEALQRDAADDRNTVRIGVGNRLELSAESLAAGTIWLERDGSWQRLRDPRAVSAPDDLRRIPIQLGPGRNRIAIELRDRIGRGVRDSAPGAAARRIVVGASELVLIADVRVDEQPPAVRTVDVEHGVDAFLVVYEDQALSRDEVVVEHDRVSFRDVTVERRDGRTRCSFRLPWSSVEQFCGWKSIPPEGFSERAAIERKLTYRTPAGSWEVAVTFQPTATLLRAVDLGQLAQLETRALHGIHLVPVLRPPSGYRVDLGPPKAATVKGSLKLQRAVRVGGIGPFFLSATEVTRRAWLAFVEDVAANSSSDDFPRKALCHHEDPLPPEARCRAAGLVPDLSLFGDTTLAKLAAGGGGDRPVTGIHYFQAHVFVRWLGYRAFGDPDLFRLPFGAELEWASLGAETDADRPRLNGLRDGALRSVVHAQREFRTLQAKARRPGTLDPLVWPASTRDLLAIGDFAGGSGDRIFGLDFGVREWVADLPLIDVDSAHFLIAQSHDRHVEFARERARGEKLPIDVTSRLANGEVRGLGWGEPVTGGVDPSTFLADAYARSGLRGLLGVKRMNYLRRDGRGLSGERAFPLVLVTGFRVAGGARLVKRVRESMR